MSPKISPIQAPATGPAINAPKMVGICNNVMANPQGRRMYPIMGKSPNNTVRAPNAPMIARFLFKLWLFAFVKFFFVFFSIFYFFYILKKKIFFFSSLFNEYIFFEAIKISYALAYKLY